MPAAPLSFSKKLTFIAALLAFCALVLPPLLTSRVPALAPAADGRLPVLPARAGQIASSAAAPERSVAPLTVPEDWDVRATFREFERVLGRLEGVRVVAREPSGFDRRDEPAEWLHLEWVSPFWRLRGDVLLIFDVAARAIEVSASSRGPLPTRGLSRRRIEALRAILADAP